MSSRPGSSSFRIIALATALALAPTARGIAQAAATGPELTAARVEQMIRALRAEQQGMTQVEGLRTRQSAMYAQADSLEHPNEACRKAAFEKLGQARGTRMMNDQAGMEKMSARLTELGEKLAAAAQKGDQKEIQRLQAEVEKATTAMTGDFSKDTAAVDKQCGKDEPSAAGEGKAAAVRKQAEALNEQIRQAESRAQQQAASTAGLTPAQYASVKERILNFFALPKTDPRARAYSSAEQSALGARQAELKAAMGR